MSNHLIKLCIANIFTGLSSLALSDDVLCNMLYKMLKGTFRSAFLDLVDGGFLEESVNFGLSGACLRDRYVYGDDASFLLRSLHSQHFILMHRMKWSGVF